MAGATNGMLVLGVSAAQQKLTRYSCEHSTLQNRLSNVPSPGLSGTHRHGYAYVRVRPLIRKPHRGRRASECSCFLRVFCTRHLFFNDAAPAALSLKVPATFTAV